ncbi:MAG: aspartyl/glutamyl-tRNA amidotransferase subunit A [Eggerthellaceae bacterium]|nr:aspartyl/glutamyl-tRNA amidotransferase subunit A [Eggerthellaceae bacterium]
MSFGTRPFAALGASALREGLLDGQFSAREAAEACLARIGRYDGGVGSFLEVTPEMALRAADEVDEKVAMRRFEELGPLAGVPVAFKDNMNLAGAHTTCGSRVLAGHVARETAVCVQRVLDAGAIPIGKLNMDEFAFGSSTETSAFGRTCNPWDLERVPGGSSGGSAAAVAAGFVPIALGSDAGGSIRQPACLCGVVGVKPTYGLVSRQGVEAFAESLDQVGPFTRCVEDAALAIDVLAGRWSAGAWQTELSRAVRDDVRGMRVGMVPSFMDVAGLSGEMREAVLRAADALALQGASLREVEIPGAQVAMDAYRVLGPCRAFENLACFDLARYGVEDAQKLPLAVGAEARRRIVLGGYLLSTDEGARYRSAAKEVCRRIVDDYKHAFGSVDVILAPVTPRAAFRFGEITDPTEMHLSDMFTVSVNLAGNTAMSMPMGLGSQTGLPVGVQIIAAAGGEREMLRAAAALERAIGGPSVAPLFSA